MGVLPSISRVDYVTLSGGLPLGSLSVTITRYGDVFIGLGATGGVGNATIAIGQAFWVNQ